MDFTRKKQFHFLSEEKNDTHTTTTKNWNNPVDNQINFVSQII